MPHWLSTASSIGAADDDAIIPLPLRPPRSSPYTSATDSPGGETSRAREHFGRSSRRPRVEGEEEDARAPCGSGAVLARVAVVRAMPPRTHAYAAARARRAAAPGRRRRRSHCGFQHLVRLIKLGVFIDATQIVASIISASFAADGGVAAAAVPRRGSHLSTFAPHACSA